MFRRYTGGTGALYNTPCPDPIDLYILIIVAFWSGTVEGYEDG